MHLPGAGPAGWGAGSGPRPHLAGDGGRCPPPAPEPLASCPRLQGARDSTSAAGAPGAQSPGRTPGRSPPSPGAQTARAAPWPPEFSEGFRGAPASESPGRFFQSTEARAPPRTCGCVPAGGAPERAFPRRCPGGLQRALGPGKRERRISPVLRGSWSSAHPRWGSLVGPRGALLLRTPAADVAGPGPARGGGDSVDPRPSPRQGLHLLSKSANFPSQEDPVLERYFKGHKAAITSVDFSPNGKQLGKFYSVFLFFVMRRSSGWYPCLLSTLGPQEDL